jgi:spore photoproduct lyase
MMAKLIKTALGSDKDLVFEIGSNSDLVLENTITQNLEWTVETLENATRVSLPSRRSLIWWNRCCR